MGYEVASLPHNSQPHHKSLLEAMTNSISGIATGYASNLWLLPLFGFTVDYQTAAAVTATFTVISIGRSYVVRRIFNLWR